MLYPTTSHTECHLASVTWEVTPVTAAITVGFQTLPATQQRLPSTPAPRRHAARVAYYTINPSSVKGINYQAVISTMQSGSQICLRNAA